MYPSKDVYVVLKDFKEKKEYFSSNRKLVYINEFKKGEKISLDSHTEFTQRHLNNKNIELAEVGSLFYS